MILLAAVALLVFPAAAIAAARACVRHVASGEGYAAAYLTTMFAAAVAAVVLHLLPQVPAIWQSIPG